MDQAQLNAVLSIATDLTASLTAADRYHRLLLAVRRVIPCDASALLRLDGDELVPVAGHGLTPEALGRRYPRREHPRLDLICAADSVVVFAPDSPLPDPFDGYLEAEPNALRHIHACLGCPLRVEGELVGALTADALAAHAFDGLDRTFVSSLGALAGAAMRTSRLIDALGDTATRLDLVARDLMRDAQLRRGGELIGTSAAMQRLRDEIAVVARSDLSVLITGETGVGKELVARTLHNGSTRADRPLLYVNCAALPESIAESELFGHVRGAFTGATIDRAGKFEVAHGGTLFLDEIGELPLGLQAKLLNVLERRMVRRLGSTKERPVLARIIAATNRDLYQMSSEGRFRSDLYYRLNVITMQMPPLRNRGQDILLLANYFRQMTEKRYALPHHEFDASALMAIQHYHWPGNVREMRHQISRAVLMCTQPVISAQALGLPQASQVAVSALGASDAPMTLEDAEKAMLLSALEQARHNVSKAARILGITRMTMRYRMDKHGISSV